MPSSELRSAVSLKSLVLCSLAGAVTLLAGGCDRQSGEKAQPQASQSAADDAPAATSKLDRSHKGAPIPAVTLVDPTGESLDLTSLKGKPLLINLWATWCGPCLREMPALDALAATHVVRVVGVAWDEEIDVRDFVQRRPPGYPVLLAAPTKTNATLFGNPSGVLPYTLLVDARGTVVRQHIGPFESADALQVWAKIE